MSCTTYEIIEETFNDELEKKILEEFELHSLEVKGSSGNLQSFAFVCRDKGKFYGAVAGKAFWGGLHIRHLLVAREWRGQGLGTHLMEKAFEWGKKQECLFAYLETLNYQALGFYRKLGFELEFTRQGYKENVAFHYLKKTL